MYTYLYNEINTFAIIITLIIFISLYNKTSNLMIEHKLFISILALNISILVFDTLMWNLDGRNTPFSRYALVISTLIYFFLQPLICMHWSLYVDFHINHNNSRIKRLQLPMSLPIILNTILCVTSLFHHLFFYIDDNNVYHRGKYIIILPLLSFSYIIYTFQYLIRNRRRITGTYFRSFLTFAFWPIGCGLIQIFFYGLPLIAIGMTISLFIVFINIQNQQMNHDYLTNLFNRRQLDLYLQELRPRNRGTMAGIFLDINSFKSINDQFGHHMGDEALKHTADLLKKSFPYSFISRLGGDEFVVLFDINSKSDLRKSVTKLKKNTMLFNQSQSLPYQLDFSIGADIFEPELKMTGQEFLNHIDGLMYQDKRLKA